MAARTWSAWVRDDIIFFNLNWASARRNHMVALMVENVGSLRWWMAGGMAADEGGVRWGGGGGVRRRHGEGEGGELRGHQCDESV